MLREYDTGISYAHTYEILGDPYLKNNKLWVPDSTAEDSTAEDRRIIHAVERYDPDSMELVVYLNSMGNFM